MPQYKKNVYVLSSIYQSSRDGFRNSVGNYWTAETFFPDYGDTKTRIKSPYMTKKRKKVDSLKIIPRNKKTKSLKTFPFLETKHDFEIYADKNIFKDDTAWIRYIQNICNPSAVYMDFCFDVENPIASGEIENQNFSPSMIYEKVDFKYNYYSKLYELTTGNSVTKETILPNLYMFLLNKEDEKNDRFFQALTAGGSLGKSNIKGVKPGKKEEFPEYFEIFGKAQRTLPADRIRRISSKSKNIIFDENSFEIMKRAEDLATSFPMQVNLEFMSDAATEFTEVLSDSKLTASLISYLSLLPRDPTPKEQKRFYIRKEPMERFFEELQPAGDLTPSLTTINKSSVDVKIIDIEKWMKKIAKSKKIVRTKNSSIIGDDSKSAASTVFEKMMYMIIFSGKLKTMVEKYHRSYTDISDGIKSYSETFCYKIEKFSDNSGSEPIQTIWLPNSNKADVMKYIDTQIKYGKRYTYRASAYQFVIGSNYRYCNMNFPDFYDAPDPVSGASGYVYEGLEQAAKSSNFNEEDMPLPTLYLGDEYFRYFSNAVDFFEEAEDLAERGILFKETKNANDIRSYIRPFEDYIQPVAVLHAARTAGRADLPPLPSYFDKSKTIFQIFKQYLSSMKSKIEKFLDLFENQYLPSISSEEKKENIKKISKDLRPSLFWIGLLDGFYTQYENRIEDFKDQMDIINNSNVNDAQQASAYLKMEEVVLETKNLSIQFAKYYENLQDSLRDYRVIDMSNTENMQQSIVSLIQDAEGSQDPESEIVSNFGALDPLVSGQSGQFAVTPSDAYSKEEYGSMESVQVDDTPDDLPGYDKKKSYYISTDKKIFKTKYANELYVVAKKRQTVDNKKYFKATLSVKVRPSIKIAEVPFFETAGTISDSPPVPPEITMIPYKGVRDKILLNLNTSIGEYEMMPVTFNRLEEIKVQEIRESKRLPSDSKITYKTDDRVAAFEIYRMETPPEKIEDFSGRLRKYLETDVNPLTLQKASSASFIDNINPNTDYYYIFRAVDIHGNVSNPTEIRKIRMVENDGAVYPLMEIYQMKKIMPQTTSKKCKKLLNIVPRSTQALINMNKSDMGDGLSAKNVKRVVLGQEDVGLFGKKFKIRLTSHKTGKQIDLNINFEVDYKQI